MGSGASKAKEEKKLATHEQQEAPTATAPHKPTDVGHPFGSPLYINHMAGQFPPLTVLEIEILALRFEEAGPSKSGEVSKDALLKAILVDETTGFTLYKRMIHMMPGRPDPLDVTSTLVTFETFVSIFSFWLTASTTEKIARLFDYFDIDSDGYLNEADLVAVLVDLLSDQPGLLENVGIESNQSQQEIVQGIIDSIWSADSHSKENRNKVPGVPKELFLSWLTRSGDVEKDIEPALRFSIDHKAATERKDQAS